MNEDKKRLIEAYEDYWKIGRDFEYWMFDSTVKLAEASIFSKYDCDTYTELMLLVNAEDKDILVTISRLRTLVKFLDKISLNENIERAFYEYKEKVKK